MLHDTCRCQSERDDSTSVRYSECCSSLLETSRKEAAFNPTKINFNNAKRFQNFGYKKGALKAFEELQMSELGKVETLTHSNGSVGNNGTYSLLNFV